MPTNSPPKRSRGRPAYEPTAAVRRKVSLAAGAGMRHEDIAIALGIARDTLAKHFAIELSSAAAARRMEVLIALHKAALKGSSSAAKAYLAAEPEIAAPPGAVAATPAAAAPAPKPAALGKKEQAAIDAQTAHIGTEWADLLKTPGAPTSVQ